MKDFRAAHAVAGVQERFRAFLREGPEAFGGGTARSAGQFRIAQRI
jgi:hypothetical protein